MKCKDCSKYHPNIGYTEGLCWECYNDSWDHDCKRTIRLVVFYPKPDKYGMHLIRDIVENEVKIRKNGKWDMLQHMKDTMFDALRDGYKVEVHEVTEINK